LVKLIDFGLAKEEGQAQTDYVATRWYRSPENLIGLRKSTVAIDIFALGCVAVEMFNQLPLFPGVDTVDQLSKLFSLLGTPSAS
jgi:serine/threonine protein kinase